MKLLHCKSFTQFFDEKCWRISDIYVLNFNERLTNKVVSFEHPSPEEHILSFKSSTSKKGGKNGTDRVASPCNSKIPSIPSSELKYFRLHVLPASGDFLCQSKPRTAGSHTDSGRRRGAEEGH